MSTVHAKRWLCVIAGAVVAAGCGSTGGPPAAAPSAASVTTSSATVAPAGAPPGVTTSTPQQSMPASASLPVSASVSAPAPAPAIASRTTAAPRPGGPGRCLTSDLTADLGWVEGAAGSRFSAVVLTNRSRHTCTIYGYGGLQLLDANHHPVATRQVRNHGVRPSLVVLRPGMSAHAEVQWSAVSNPGDSQNGACQPEPAFLLVTPPDETRSLSVRWKAESVCARGAISQGPYTAGLPSTPEPLPAPVPAAVVAVAFTGGGSGEVLVEWKAAPQATGYRVIRTTAAGGRLRVVASFSITTGRATAAAETATVWSDSHTYIPYRGPLTGIDRSSSFRYVAVRPGRSCYRVQAYNLAGNSPLSSVVCAAPPGK